MFVLNPTYHWWSELPKTKEPVVIHWGIVLGILFVLFILTFVADFLMAKYKNKRVTDDETKFVFDLVGVNSIDYEGR